MTTEPQSQDVSALARQFTMLELLVVIGIISILASLLLPALKSATDEAKAISCTSMMRQRSLWARFYESDWNSYLPLAGHQSNTKNIWHSQMYTYSNMNLETFIFKGVSCPGDSSPNTPYTDTPAVKLSFIYNNWLGNYWTGATNSGYVKLDTIKNPSACGRMIDGHVESSDTQSRLMSWMVAWGMPTYYVSFRHMQRANLLYVDGHVDKLSKVEIESIPIVYNTLGKGE